MTELNTFVKDAVQKYLQQFREKYVHYQGKYFSMKLHEKYGCLVSQT